MLRPGRDGDGPSSARRIGPLGSLTLEREARIVTAVPDAMRCCKPGCGAPTAARLTYDHGGATAWVDDPGGEGGWSLCATHADRLRVPTGWAMIDRRVRRETRPLLAS
jgi:Protein of unknown function (DUF3499)